MEEGDRLSGKSSGSPSEIQKLFLQKGKVWRWGVRGTPGGDALSRVGRQQGLRMDGPGDQAVGLELLVDGGRGAGHGVRFVGRAPTNRGWRLRPPTIAVRQWGWGYDTPLPPPYVQSPVNSVL